MTRYRNFDNTVTVFLVNSDRTIGYVTYDPRVRICCRATEKASWSVVDMSVAQAKTALRALKHLLEAT